jgi:cysteinyl-tRNA synthetase
MKALLAIWREHFSMYTHEPQESSQAAEALEYAVRMSYFFGCEVMQQRMLEIYSGHKTAAEVEKLVKETQDEITSGMHNITDEIRQNIKRSEH